MSTATHQSTPRARVKASVEQAQHEAAQRDAAARLAAAHDDFLQSMKVSVSVRKVVSVVVGLLSYGVTVYYMSTAVNVLTAIVLTTTGSMLLSFLTLLLGYCVAIYASMHIGYTVSSYVSSIDFDAIGNAARDVRNAAVSKVSLVRGWFAPAAQVQR